MKKNHLSLLLTIATAAVMMTACGMPTAESEEEAEQTSSITTATSESALSSDTDSSEEHEKDTSNAIVEEDSSVDSHTDSSETSSDSKKETYTMKINAVKEVSEHRREKPSDQSTYDMKHVEGDLWDLWNVLLNEIYGVLKEQLPEKEMNALRQEQRAWIQFRDKSAKEASLVYEGGTMEQLEYMMVENKLTEERCSELVDQYMK